jgi:hypothetical protein
VRTPLFSFTAAIMVFAGCTGDDPGAVTYPDPLLRQGLPVGDVPTASGGDTSQQAQPFADVGSSQNPSWSPHSGNDTQRPSNATQHAQTPSSSAGVVVDTAQGSSAGSLGELEFDELELGDVALGDVDIPSGTVSPSTENTAVIQAVLADLAAQGISVTRSAGTGGCDLLTLAACPEFEMVVTTCDCELVGAAMCTEGLRSLAQICPSLN